jgi:hypothetical protein
MAFNYCDITDVNGELLGLDVSDLPATLVDRINNDYIPFAKREVDSYVGESFDLKRVREFYNGNNMPTLPLRHKPIHQVDVVTLRIVPSMKWFQFRRWFYIKNTAHDGTVVTLSGGVEPVGTFFPKYETPYLYPTSQSEFTPTSATPNVSFSDTTAQYEASDLHVDSANGVLVIPPRVLFIESQGVPFWNYTWVMGQRNIEVVYSYGYKNLASLPFELRKATAKLVAAKVLQQKGLWASAGAKSISEDGVSKSFGEGAYSTEIKALKEEAYAVLNRYKRITV